MSTSIEERVLNHIAASNAIAERAVATEKQAAEKAAAVAAATPALVEALVANGFIQASEREKAASYLQDPVKSLQLMGSIIKRAAEIRAERSDAVGRIGSPAGGTKTASTKTAAVKESDRAWFNALGLSVPTGS